MKRVLSILLILVTCSGISAGVWALTLKNPHFGPTTEATLIREGRENIDDGNYAAAIEKFRLAIYRNPRSTKAYIGLADAFVLDGDPEGAVAYLRNGLKVQESFELRNAYEQLMVVVDARKK